MNIAVMLVILLLAVLMAALKWKVPKDSSFPFERREPFFSPAERSFFGVLEQALDNRYRVFGKVRVGDLVKPAKGLSKSRRTAALNKVNQKHVDYVVCAATDLAVLGVVELDDQSHGREDRAARDAFVDQALRGAGISIVHFSAKKGYQIHEVRNLLAEALNLTLNVSTPTLSQAQEAVSPQLISISAPGPTPVAQTEPTDTIPICEKCGATMVKRKAKNGEHAGKFFWACSSFPKCRKVVAIT